jgi:hypothetical protein
MQGAMLHQYDFSQKGWISGTGLQAKWKPIDWSNKYVDPQFLMDAGHGGGSGLRTLHRRVARNTDARTMIASLSWSFPAGDKAPVLTTRTERGDVQLVSVLNSFVFDRMLRDRCGSTNIDLASLEAMPLPKRACPAWEAVRPLVVALNGAWRLAATTHVLQGTPVVGSTVSAVRRLCCVSAHERLRVEVLVDAVVAALFTLNAGDLEHVLRDSDLPTSRVGDRGVQSTLDPKGFWRIDKDVEPELRHTVLTLVAFHELQRSIAACGGDQDRGIEAFLTQNSGEGWLLPETLRLADYGLGHDDRAKEPQPVASRLGPRFYDWQLAQSPEDSWRECHLHARNLLGKPGYLDLLADTLLDKPVSAWADALAHASDVTATEDLIHIFARPLARLGADTWRSTLDDIGHLVTSRGLSFEASHRTQLVERVLRITVGDRRQPALRAAIELLSAVEVDAILTSLLAILEGATDTAWRKVIRASVDSQRFERLTSGTSVAGGPPQPRPVAAAPKSTPTAAPKQTSFFPDSKG